MLHAYAHFYLTLFFLLWLSEEQGSRNGLMWLLIPGPYQLQAIGIGHTYVCDRLNYSADKIGLA
jgi:hypothetical protein